MALTREQILEGIASRKRSVETVPIEEWGGDVGIRRLQIGALEDAGYFRRDDGSPIVIDLLLTTICGDDGEPLFAAEDAKLLLEAEATIAMRLFARAAKINGLSNEKLEEAVSAFAGAQSDEPDSE